METTYRNLRIKVMDNGYGAPLACLCDNDMRIDSWIDNYLRPAYARIASRERWNPDIPGIHGGQYESVVTQDALGQAVATLEGVAGQKLDVVICASMVGRIL